MLDYAVKLTRHPGGMTADDTGALRAAGFDDRAILDICQIVAYYNYVNRLADGLGVELEAGWRDGELTLTRREFEAQREVRWRGVVAGRRGAAAGRADAGAGQQGAEARAGAVEQPRTGGERP